jgi:hypothetical protein
LTTHERPPPPPRLPRRGGRWRVTAPSSPSHPLLLHHGHQPPPLPLSPVAGIAWTVTAPSSPSQPPILFHGDRRRGTGRRRQAPCSTSSRITEILIVFSCVAGALRLQQSGAPKDVADQSIFLPVVCAKHGTWLLVILLDQIFVNPDYVKLFWTV